MNTETPYIQLSVETKMRVSPEVLESQRVTLQRQLGNRGFRAVALNRGAVRVYLDTPENHAAKDTIYRLARRYGQRCVMERDANGQWECVWLHPDIGGPDVRQRQKVLDIRAHEEYKHTSHETGDL